jgi:hypothetical protein
MRTVHITLQGKGGVGKSFVASVIAQHYHQTGRANELVCVDTDPINRTLQGYTALNAWALELMADGGEIISRNFDSLMERAVQEDRHFVVDNGASSFVPLMNYMVENDAVGVLTKAGKKVVVHTVITGGQAIIDTLAGFDTLAKSMPEQAELVVWLNEFFGDIEVDGKPFEQMKVYERHKARVSRVIRIPRQTGSTFGKDMELLLHKRMTFAEVPASSEFGLMAKQRLSMMGSVIFKQLDQLA